MGDRAKRRVGEGRIPGCGDVTAPQVTLSRAGSLMCVLDRSPRAKFLRSVFRRIAASPIRPFAHSLLIASRASVLGMVRAFSLLISISGIAMGGSWKYPVAKKGDVVDDYAGTKVADPYRWLENTDSPETIAWIKAENDISLPFLEKLPDRQDFHDRMTKLLNYERYSTPYWVGDRYIYQKNDGLQNQSVIYTVKNLDDTPQLVLDPNQLAKDGTVSVGIESLSNDGRFFAYGLESSGSDWTEIHVKDLDSGKELPDMIKWVKFSDVGWSKARARFFSPPSPKPHTHPHHT